MITIEQSHDLVKRIYHEAYRVPIGEFKQVCFELLAEHFDIDSGTWITRCEREIPFYEQDSFTFQLPDGFIEDYHHLSTVSNQVHQVFGVMLGNLGKTLDILDVVPEQEWFGSDMYKLYCEKFDLHHSLMTVTANPVNQAVNIITFARHHADKHFTQEEKWAKEFVVPNLIEAMRVNILNSFHQGRSNASAYRAVLDRYGNLIEAEEGFLNLINRFSLTENNKLMINLNGEQGEYQADNFCLNYQNHNGLVYAELLTSPVLQSLGNRKLEICRYLLTGLSNKEIAKMLNIAPNTVSNHMKEIFKTLNVSSRQEAIGYLMRQEELN